MRGVSALAAELYSIGEILVDLVFTEPIREGARIEVHFGGAPANLAVGVSRLGHKAGFIGAVGSDDFGRLLINTLKAYGIDTEMVKVKKARTTLAFVIVDEKGERTFFFYTKPWSNTASTMLEITDVDLDKVCRSKILHFTGFSTSHPPLSDTVYAVVQHALKKGVKISYDPTFRKDIWPSREHAVEAFRKSLELSTIVSLSIDEVIEFYNTTDYVGVANHMIRNYPGIEAVAIRLGSKGAYVKTRSGREAYAEAFKVKVVDTTGAGDAWTAAFLVSYILEKMDLDYSVKFANAAAALVCTKYGAITSYPSRDEVEDFMKKQGL